MYNENGERIIKTHPKYIYVSNTCKGIIEEIAKQKAFILNMRFINEYKINNFISSILQNLQGIDYLILDLKAFQSSSDNEIIFNLKLLRKCYDCRIIILNEGERQGNVLLGKIFNLGIYNIITAGNDIEFKEEMELAFSEEGMTFRNAVKYQVEESTIQINQNSKVVEKNYIQVKQTVTIGICSCEKHQGATTLAINLTAYLNSLANTKACYIEYNNHDSIMSLTDNKQACFYNNSNKISFKGIDLFLKPSSIAEIQKNEYDFYIYDFGNFDEMTEEQKDSFATRDLKIIVSGNREWEQNSLINCIYAMRNDNNAFLFFNFTAFEDRKELKESVGKEWQEKVFFSDLIYFPFEVKNPSLYQTILKPYLLNQVIEEKKKIFSIGNILKKGKKNQ